MKANLRSRIATAVIGIPVLIFVIGWGRPWLFPAVVMLLAAAALREFFAMALPGRPGEQTLGILFGLALAFQVYDYRLAGERSGAALLLLFYFSVYLFNNGDLKERLTRLAWGVLGGFYLGYLLPHWILLFRRPDGRYWVGFVLLVVMSGDSMAYFVGSRFGKRKLAPRISPGKTVEGAVGYIGGSVAAGVIAARWLAPALATAEITFLSLVLSVLGQLGDLFESWLKRAFGMKDSGQILPGHGGAMDRLDSLIFPAVFTAAYLKLLHP